MNRTVEIHDSTLNSLTTDRGLLVLHFSSAYVHESVGIPSVDSGTGGVQEAYLKIGNAVVAGSFSKLPGDSVGGHIRIGGLLSDNMIPVPLDHLGQVEFRLEKYGETVSITGTSAKLELVGEATYVEEFRP